MIVDDEQVGAQLLAECDRFQLSPPETFLGRASLDWLDLEDPAAEVGLEPLGLGLSRYQALPKNSRGNNHSAELLIEKGEGITGGESHQRRGIRDGQHQARARSAWSSASRSSAG